MIAKKKSDKANLEKSRFAFFQIGLIVAAAFCLAAFQYSTIKLDKVAKIELEELDVLTSYELPPEEIVFEELKQPPKKVQKIKIKIEVEPVPNDEKIIEVKKVKINLDNTNVTLLEGQEGDPNGTELPPLDTTTYIIVTQMPEFPGGDAALMQWVNDNIKVSPFAEPMDGIVYVSFVVDPNGKVKNVTLGRGIHRDYDNASLAVVKKMPNWSPGEQAGKKVNVRYDLPIRFIGR